MTDLEKIVYDKVKRKGVNVLAAQHWRVGCDYVPAPMVLRSLQSKGLVVIRRGVWVTA